jgi:benzodiazapine receptor
MAVRVGRVAEREGPDNSGRSEDTWAMQRSNMRALAAAAAPPAAAAVIGNAFVGRGSLRWFRDLDRPRMQLPLPAFLAVGATYYAQLGWVLHRARQTEDRRARNRALLVLAANELWNAAFFGRRSPRAGFLGVLAFLVPLLALQNSVASDRPSLVVLTPYMLWVIGYDVPWTYQVWRLNPNPPH